MSTTTQIFVVIMGMTVIIGFLWGFLTLCEYMVIWRQWFRDQFLEGCDTWQWHKIHSKNRKTGFLWVFEGMNAWEIARGMVTLVLFFLLWFVVEALAILGGLIIGLVTIIMIYTIATSIRDWWHKGSAR